MKPEIPEKYEIDICPDCLLAYYYREGSLDKKGDIEAVIGEPILGISKQGERFFSSNRCECCEGLPGDRITVEVTTIRTDRPLEDSDLEELSAWIHAICLADSIESIYDDRLKTYRWHDTTYLPDLIHKQWRDYRELIVQFLRQQEDLEYDSSIETIVNCDALNFGKLGCEIYPATADDYYSYDLSDLIEDADENGYIVRFYYN